MVPDLEGSWEQVPSNLIDFAARDRRWCQGNLQHLGVMPLKGLHWVSRIHMVTGVLAYATSPLWMVVLILSSIVTCQEAIRDIFVDEKVKRYVLEIVHTSRAHEDVLLGGSPRASIALFRTAQAMAAVNGRDFVLPDDVKKMAHPVLGHRLILKPESRLRKRTPALVVADLISDARVPITDKQRDMAVDDFDR